MSKQPTVSPMFPLPCADTGMGAPAIGAVSQFRERHSAEFEPATSRKRRMFRASQFHLIGDMGIS
jgi:hypothetical protein